MAMFEPPMSSETAGPATLHVLGEKSPPMMPGTYLRKRREAAGLTIEQAVRKMHEKCTGTIFALLLEHWEKSEAGEIPFGSHASNQISWIMPFDNSIYDTLVAISYGHDLPVPQICRNCGCSFHDPCCDNHGHNCAWSDHDSSLCTHCESPFLLGGKNAT